MFSDAVGRRPAVAGVAALAVAGDVGRAARPQIEPADALVVEIAEVERAVRPMSRPYGLLTCESE